MARTREFSSREETKLHKIKEQKWLKLTQKREKMINLSKHK